MRFVIVVALVTGTVPVVAQDMKLPDTAPGTPDLRKVVKGTYRLNPDHTQVLFTVNHLGFTEYTGMFTHPAGTLTLDPATPSAAKVVVSFPVAEVRTTVAALDVNLQKADLLDAAKFPTATFISTGIVPRGSTATITGQLTLHGVTKPIVLHARFIGAGREFWGDKKAALGFAATTVIKRSDFGISANIPLVSDQIDLVINAGFESQ